MSIRLISMASALALTLAASAASAMPASGEQPLFNDQADVPSVVTRAEMTAQATQSPPTTGESSGVVSVAATDLPMDRAAVVTELRQALAHGYHLATGEGR